jgi:hypothetical protein
LLTRSAIVALALAAAAPHAFSASPCEALADSTRPFTPELVAPRIEQMWL